MSLLPLSSDALEPSSTDVKLTSDMSSPENSDALPCCSFVRLMRFLQARQIFLLEVGAFL